jgi:hypothetical protein
MSPLERILEGKSKDLGGFCVTRILPVAQRRHVGPFVFYDQMGPAQFNPGEGINVRPHPHIGWRPSPICLTARWTIATVWACTRPSIRVM